MTRSPYFLFLLVCAGIFVLIGCSSNQKIEFESVLKDRDQEYSGIPDNIRKLAETDHIRLLKQALAKYEEQKISNYTCTLEKQEFIQGSMKKVQVVSVKFMEKPFSLFMEWKKNPPLGDRFVYVEGRYSDKNNRSQMLVRPKGIFSLLAGKSVLRLPDCKDAMKNTLKPCTEFGFNSALNALQKYYLLAEQNNVLNIASGGGIEIGGRKCVVLIREIRTESAGDEGYPAKITEVCLDVETLLPLRIVGYDWDNRMFCTYEFRDVKINPGLTEKDFTPEACGIEPPKK